MKTEFYHKAIVLQWFFKNINENDEDLTFKMTLSMMAYLSCAEDWVTTAKVAMWMGVSQSLASTNMELFKMNKLVEQRGGYGSQYKLTERGLKYVKDFERTAALVSRLEPEGAEARLQADDIGRTDAGKV